jgi:ADP-ribose pyrophosphatase YjhB (NUDIX family)
MLVIQPESVQCSYRVAGMVLHNGHLLMQWEKGIWTVPGGRVLPEEPARTALKHIIFASLGIDVEVEQLLWVAEHIFDRSGQPVYDLTFYFQVAFPPALRCFPRNTPITWIDKGAPVTFCWIPLANLDHISSAPPCLRQALATILERRGRIFYYAEDNLLLAREACA